MRDQLLEAIAALRAHDPTYLLPEDTATLEVALRNHQRGTYALKSHQVANDTHSRDLWMLTELPSQPGYAASSLDWAAYRAALSFITGLKQQELSSFIATPQTFKVPTHCALALISLIRSEELLLLVLAAWHPEAPVFIDEGPALPSAFLRMLPDVYVDMLFTLINDRACDQVKMAWAGSSALGRKDYIGAMHRCTCPITPVNQQRLHEDIAALIGDQLWSQKYIDVTSSAYLDLLLLLRGYPFTDSDILWLSPVIDSDVAAQLVLASRSHTLPLALQNQVVQSFRQHAEDRATIESLVLDSNTSGFQGLVSASLLNSDLQVGATIMSMINQRLFGPECSPPVMLDTRYLLLLSQAISDTSSVAGLTFSRDLLNPHMASAEELAQISWILVRDTIMASQAYRPNLPSTGAVHREKKAFLTTILAYTGQSPTEKLLRYLLGDHPLKDSLVTLVALGEYFEGNCEQLKRLLAHAAP